MSGLDEQVIFDISKCSSCEYQVDAWYLCKDSTILGFLNVSKEQAESFGTVNPDESKLRIEDVLKNMNAIKCENCYAQFYDHRIIRHVINYAHDTMQRRGY